MGNNEEFIQEIGFVISEVEQELKRRETGIPGDGNIKQLKLALRELKKIKEEITNNDLPPKEDRTFEIGWYIVDSWSVGTKLGEKLLSIGQKYKKDF